MPTTTPSRAAARRATRSVVTVAFVAAVGGSGAASAYWSAPGGAGAGHSGTGVTTAVTLTPGAVRASLHPGGTGDVSTEARNPDAATVVLTTLQLDTTQGSDGLAVDAEHPACPATAFSFTAPDDGGTGWTVPGRVGNGDGILAITLPHALRLAADAPNGCQGATVTVFLRSA
jgi:hypothetical protein